MLDARYRSISEYAKFLLYLDIKLVVQSVDWFENVNVNRASLRSGYVDGVGAQVGVVNMNHLVVACA